MSQEEMTEPEYRVLLELDVRGPQPTNDLAGVLNLEPAVVAHMCGRLVSGGLAQRFQRVNDGRCRTVFVALTDAGSALVSRLERCQRSA